MMERQPPPKRAFFGNKLQKGLLVAVAMLSLAVTGLPTASSNEFNAAHSFMKKHWVGTWSASPLPADAGFFAQSLGFENQTIRQIAHLSIGGKQVRVRLSNAYNAVPLTIGAAHVAVQNADDSIRPETDRALTFAGEPFITIPPGGLAVSDPVNLDIPACTDLAVSIYVPEATGPTTWHEIGQQTTYISTTGDFTGATSIPVATTDISRYWLSGIEVTTRRPVVSLVAFGDSITDGWGSTPDLNQRWPDIVSEHLNCNPSHPGFPHRNRYGRLGILNQGISGNRVLYDLMGTNATARFDQDALAQTGAKHVFIVMGINDIGIPGAFGIPQQEVTEDDIITGLSQLVTRAKAQGLRVYGGTLTPFEGTTFPGYYSEAGEYKRTAVNEWIRTSGAFDVVVDFDAVLQDPEYPTRLLPAYDSGDHLHPSDAGYNAMADAVLEALF